MSLERRLSRLECLAERHRLQRLYDAIAAEYGFDGRELLEEAEAFLSLPLDQQLAEVDRIHQESLAQGIPWDEVEAIKATLTEHYRP